MTSMDKEGIGITIAIVAVFLGITSIFGFGTEILPVIEKNTIQIKETGQEMKESGSEPLERIKEITKQVSKETKEFGEITEEFASAKLPSRLVSIPTGTTFP